MRRYLPILDDALTGLVTRLRERGLLESTLIVCMGEMGRTPRINQRSGRDHFGRAWSVAMAGAGLRTGQAVGSSTADGGAVQDRPIRPEDLFATIFRAAGISPATEIHPRTGRPIVSDPRNPQMVPGALPIVARTARPVEELFA